MISISELLGRFKNLGLGERLSKEVLVEEINNIIGSNLLTTKDIKIKNSVAFIRVQSALKSEIFLHKDEILKRARQKAGASFVVSDVR
jgi:hypothetical protein